MKISDETYVSDFLREYGDIADLIYLDDGPPTSRWLLFSAMEKGGHFMHPVNLCK